MARKRVILDGSRILPAAITGWIVNHSTKNYWRVASWYELDDLIGDGLMKAYECLEKYGEPGVDIDSPHFMALVKTAFHRHIAEVLRHSRPDQELVVKAGDVAGEMSDSDYIDRAAEPVGGTQDFAVLIAQLPDSIRRVIELYLNRPEELRKKTRACLDGEPETEAGLLKRLAGFPLRHDFEAELRRYLLGDLA